MFNADGALVANAPHMPVHLGSMDKSVETIIANNPVMHPGDVFMLNAPYNGGTHLPDITVVTPVFDTRRQDHPVLDCQPRPPRRCRRHGAGLHDAAGNHHPRGRRRHRQFQDGRQGHLPGETKPCALLTAGEYPCRNPAQNIADLKAQIAANEKGVQELRKMVAQFGLDVVQAYMNHVQDNAEESVRRVIGALHDCEYDYEMDAGQHIKVKITVDRESRTADGRLHRHQRAAAEQLQRAAARHQRRRAVRVPRAWWPTTSR